MTFRLRRIKLSWTPLYMPVHDPIPARQAHGDRTWLPIPLTIQGFEIFLICLTEFYELFFSPLSDIQNILPISFKSFFTVY